MVHLAGVEQCVVLRKTGERLICNALDEALAERRDAKEADRKEGFEELSLDFVHTLASQLLEDEGESAIQESGVEEGGLVLFLEELRLVGNFLLVLGVALVL